QRQPAEICSGPAACHRRYEVPDDRHRQNRTDDSVEGQADRHQRGAPGYGGVHAHGSCLGVLASAGGGVGGPSFWGRCAASQATQEGRLASSSPPSGFAQPRTPSTIESICASVSIPPALCANAGIAVPGTPVVATRRMTASSAIARNRGSPSGIAAPLFPSGP